MQISRLSSKSSKFLSAFTMNGATKLKIAEFYCKKNSTSHEYRNNFFDSNKKIEVIDLEVEKLNNRLTNKIPSIFPPITKNEHHD